MNDTLRNIVETHLTNGQVLLDATEDSRGNYLRIVIDSEDKITLNDTTRLTKVLRDSIEIDSMYPSGYRLEVSTPGLNNPLKFPFQYKKNINRALAVSYIEDEVKKKVKGKLVEISDNKIELKCSDKGVIIYYEQIIDAKVIVSFK
tara:strand:+ start:809 stop:1246 length:438 start_codon:yes stop_codon:yes gene_type:complete